MSPREEVDSNRGQQYVSNHVMAKVRGLASRKTVLEVDVWSFVIVPGHVRKRRETVKEG